MAEIMNQHSQKPMRSVWHSLLWKEWHEHKWKLTMLILLVLIIAAMFREGGRDLQMLPMAVSTALFLYCFLSGLFVGMSTAAGENGRGTMSFLQTLPLPMRKPAAAKLLMSWLTVVIPVFVLIGLTYAYLNWLAVDDALLHEAANWSRYSGGIFQPWGFQHWLLGFGLTGILMVSSLLLWTAATGANRSDEIRAGAIGFLIMATVWLCIVILADRGVKANLPLLKKSTLAAMAAAPGGPGLIGSLSQNVSPVPFVLAGALGHGCLLAWYLRRFGQKSVRPARTLGGTAAPVPTDWLAPPRRNQLTAIIWKQASETGPLALMAAAAVVAMACLAYWANYENQYQNSFGEILGGITLAAGFLVTVVAGMGVFLEDLKPGIGQFWRSRPVNTTQWFFVKFFTGLFVLAITFGALFLLAILFQRKGIPLLDSEYAGVQIAFFALTFMLIYTLSMASYCLSRQPIVAAVATLCIFICGIYAWGTIFNRIAPHWSVAMAALFVAQITAITIAWLAVRNNWGLQK